MITILYVSNLWLYISGTKRYITLDCLPLHYFDTKDPTSVEWQKLASCERCDDSKGAPSQANLSDCSVMFFHFQIIPYATNDGILSRKILRI